MAYCYYVLSFGFFRIVFSLFRHTYNLDCPSFSQWKLRGFGRCNISYVYTCLLDANKNEYSENCAFGLSLLEPGYAFVIRGMLDRKTCEAEWFQPFPLLSNISSRCVSQKSQCKGEGQIVYRNGTTTYDRSCRCNYIDNFVFVTNPKAKCFCIPSEEDCSCINKSCAVDHYLTPDYQCFHFSNWTGTFQCPAIQHEVKQNIVVPKRTFSITESVTDPTKKMNTIVLYLVSIVLVFLLCAGFFICGTCYMYYVYVLGVKHKQGIKLHRGQLLLDISKCKMEDTRYTLSRRNST